MTVAADIQYSGHLFEDADCYHPASCIKNSQQKEVRAFVGSFTQMRYDIGGLGVLNRANGTKRQVD